MLSRHELSMAFDPTSSTVCACTYEVQFSKTIGGVVLAEVHVPPSINEVFVLFLLSRTQ